MKKEMQNTAPPRRRFLKQTLSLIPIAAVGGSLNPLVA